MSTHAQKFVLPNGLTVIHEYVPQVGVVTLQVGVRVGSAFETETEDEAGISHLIEHMVFKGTPSFAAGEIATRVEGAGGELNAYTSFDQTVYYITLPHHHVALGLKLIKEMTCDPLFDPEELEREKEVVVEEIKRGLDSPNNLFNQKVFGAHFTDHPYGRPIIGYENTVRALPAETLHRYHKHHYRTRNMVLGVCGDIKSENLMALLQENFATVSTGAETGTTPPLFQASREGTKTVFLPWTHPLTLIDMIFSAPHVTHEDVPMLDLLSHLFGESDTSLLQQNIKEKRHLVHQIHSSSYTPRFGGIFSIGAQLDTGKINATLSAIRSQIDHVRQIPFDRNALERAKVLARAHLIFDQETCEGTARRWMTYETALGDYAYDQKYLAAIESAQPEHLLQIAQKYLLPENVLFVLAHPQEQKIKWDEACFLKPSTQPAKIPSSVSADKIIKLKNGLRVVLRQNSRLPLVSCKISCMGGLRHENVKNNGIGQLLASVVTKGTVHLDQEELAKRCESLAAHIGGYQGRNSWGLSMSFLADKLTDAIPLLAEVFTQPSLDKNEISKEKKTQLEAIRNQSDNPAQLAFRATMQCLFGTHPYAMPSIGTKKSVSALSQASLKGWHQSIIDPKHTVLCVVGDIHTKEIYPLLERHFGSYKHGKSKSIRLTKPKPPRGVIRLFQEKPKNQAHIAIGMLGNTVYDKDKFAFEILNNALCGQGGRLFLELRDKQSLAYTVTSSMLEGIETGFFSAYIATDPSKVEKAVSGLFHELQNIAKRGLSQEELQRAQQYILGNLLIDRQKNSQIAMQMCLNELYGLGAHEFDKLEKRILAVKHADITRAARHYLTLENCVVSVVGPKGCFKAD